MKISYTQSAVISMLLLLAVGFAPVLAQQPASPTDEPAVEQAPVDQIAVEQAAAEQAAAEQAAAEQAAAEQAAAEQAAAEQAAAEQAAAEQAAAEQAAAEQAAAEQAAAEQAAAEQAAAEQAAAEQAAEEAAVAPAPASSSGVPFGLYVEVAGGTGGADPIEVDIFSEADIAAGIGDFEVTDTIFGRAAVGWKFPNAKGSLRLVFQGHKEDTYEFSTYGSLLTIGGGQTVDTQSGLAPWWFIDVSNGKLTARKMIPTWTTADDLDDDLFPDAGKCSSPDATGIMSCGELKYDTLAPVSSRTTAFPDDLQNRINTYDLVYGREFGGRKFNSHWFAGLRYFEYEGQLLGGAWLAFGAPVGEGFTDGDFLKLLRISQETTGAGPVGSWEVRYNLFQQALQLFVKAEVAFTLNDMSIDSEPFFQVDVAEGLLLEDRLQKDLEKSTWQNKIELGSRLHFKNGLHLELAYALTGYLDFVLVPDLLQLEVTNPKPQTNSQDLVIDTFHFGAGFQF